MSLWHPISNRESMQKEHGGAFGYLLFVPLWASMDRDELALWHLIKPYDRTKEDMEGSSYQPHLIDHALQKL
jgi:hypothetical protein